MGRREEKEAARNAEAERMAAEQERAAIGQEGPNRTAEGTPPKTGSEAGGGVVEEGTGDFAPEDTSEPEEASEGHVLVEDRTGAKVEVPVGADGEAPVSPQNPPRKAMLGGGDEARNTETAKAQNDGAEGDRVTDDK